VGLLAPEQERGDLLEGGLVLNQEQVPTLEELEPGAGNVSLEFALIVRRGDSVEAPGADVDGKIEVRQTVACVVIFARFELQALPQFSIGLVGADCGSTLRVTDHRREDIRMCILPLLVIAQIRDPDHANKAFLRRQFLKLVEGVGRAAFPTTGSAGQN
jgi:hypothetical protein